MTQADLIALVHGAAAALMAGKHGEARQKCEAILARNKGNIQVWFIHAYACLGTGDPTAAEAAVDRILMVQPENIRALIVKGDCRARCDDSRGTARFYSRAIQLAEGQKLPEDLAQEVARARVANDASNAAFRKHMDMALAGRPLPARFAHAIDLLNGERKIYYQSPSIFYYPELPQRQFYEREEFDWTAVLEKKTDIIAEELRLLLNNRDDFRPYLVSDTKNPRREFHGLNDNPAWSTLYLHDNGLPVAANVSRAPQSWAAIDALPLCRIGARAPVVMFSLLQAKSRIPAHCGVMNTRLICHLPLVVPPGCGFRVGNEVREWEVGKLLIFDDTIEHEAWNDSDEDRVVLIFDIWRPELSAAERDAVTAMFAAIDGVGPAAR